MSTPHQLFISYRRDDGGHAGRLYDQLIAAFSKDAVFIDTQNLTPGQPFRQELDDRIRGARFCLVVIGQHWFSETNRTRLFENDDVTRGEIRVALECLAARTDYVVIPVLAGDAHMPKESQLPPDIAKLPRDTAHILVETNYATSANTLIDLLMNRYGFQSALITKAHQIAFKTIHVAVAAGHVTKEVGDKVSEKVLLGVLEDIIRPKGGCHD